MLQYLDRNKDIISGDDIDIVTRRYGLLITCRGTFIAEIKGKSHERKYRWSSNSERQHYPLAKYDKIHIEWILFEDPGVRHEAFIEVLEHSLLFPIDNK